MSPTAGTLTPIRNPGASGTKEIAAAAHAISENIGLGVDLTTEGGWAHLTQADPDVKPSSWVPTHQWAIRPDTYGWTVQQTEGLSRGLSPDDAYTCAAIGRALTAHAKTDHHGRILKGKDAPHGPVDAALRAINEGIEEFMRPTAETGSA